jgi:O-acetyl-ADP-ribose deacetylase (regulator of RNase III)
MIFFVKGNIFDSPAQALINPVNTSGVMGKGLAKEFKFRYSNNYMEYIEACKNGNIAIGKLFGIQENGKIIINFPTKEKWQDLSKYEYISKGLDDLIKIIKKYRIESIAIPKLGCGNGGLEWDKVKKLIVNKLTNVEKFCNIYIY